MWLKTFEVEAPDEGKFIHIEPLGDIHIGNPGCMVDKLKERIEAISKDETRYWIGMGDYIDNLRPYRQGSVDKRWTTEVFKGVADWDLQIREIVSLFEPIKDKCIGLLWGNHEWATMTVNEFSERVCGRLGVDFLGSRAFILLRVKRGKRVLGEYVIFAVHGSYSGTRVGGAINRVQDISRVYDADIYLMAHTHSKAYQAENRVALYLTRSGKVKIVERPVVYVLTGGFLNPYMIGYDGYMDRNPLPRSIRVGTVTVGIDVWRGKIHGFE